MNVQLTVQEMEALKLIATGKVCCQGLAENLKVSRPTAARVVSSLRKKGFRVATRREESYWRYEILPEKDVSARGIVGMLGGKAARDASTHHDDYLIEDTEEKARKAKKSLKRGA